MGKDSAQKERSNSLLSSDLVFDETSGKSVDVKVEASSSSASSAAANSSQASSKANRTGRLRPRTKQQIVNELYVGLVQEMMFNEEHLPSNLRKVPWDRRTALGVLLNPMRVPTVMGKPRSKLNAAPLDLMIPPCRALVSIRGRIVRSRYSVVRQELQPDSRGGKTRQRFVAAAASLIPKLIVGENEDGSRSYWFLLRMEEDTALRPVEEVLRRRRAGASRRRIDV